MAEETKSRRSFGQVRKLPSGKFQARYRRNGVWYPAPVTFSTEKRAAATLDAIELDIEAGRWTPPTKAKGKPDKPATFREYASVWLAERGIEQTTRDHNAQLLRDHINPTFGATPLPEITADAVRTWHAKLGRKNIPVQRSHAYGLLRTIMNTALDDELIAANPCRIKGAGRAKTTKKMRPATPEELAIIVREMPERLRVMVQLAVWCSLRFGELAELRRSDVDLKAGLLRIERGVTRTKGRRVVKGPKSEAGVRDVTIPSHIAGDLENHLRDHTGSKADALLFPAAHGGHLAPSTLYRSYYPAREAAGRTDLRFHDLRHTGQTWSAAVGANLRELMARAGQSSPGAALRYLHQVDGRQREIADALAAYASGKVVPIGSAKKKPAKRRAKKAARTA